MACYAHGEFHSLEMLETLVFSFEKEVSGK